MVDQEKKSLLFLLLFLIVILVAILVGDFLSRVGLINQRITGIAELDEFLTGIIFKSRPWLRLIRTGLIISMISLSLFRSKSINQSGGSGLIILPVFTTLVIILFVTGYTDYLYYNTLIYPLIFVSLFILIPKSVEVLDSSLRRANNQLRRVSKKSDEFSFSFKTDKGQLNIHDIRTATFIEGSAKAGKTGSIILPVIVQAIQKQFAGLIYDYEGDLTEEGGGLLTRVAYTAMRSCHTPVTFAVLNFTDLSRTVRCNPLSTRYIKSYNHALEMSTVIMYNINRTWSKHKDFWGENAIAAYAANIWFFQRNFPLLSTIPHITEFLLNDFRNVLTILNTDDDVAPYVRPILGALERDASGQIAGAESSTQFPLAKMRSPEVYYVFNPEPENEFDLDITNKERPVLLSICNAPEIQNALAPAIGAVIQVCKVQMNKLGKHKSIFLFDEMPTVYIDRADKIPAEARKKSVCAFFAVQTYEQLVRDYGVQNAKVIRNSCGNIFNGISSVESAELVSRMMGEFKQADYSRTASDSGQSTTQSYRNEKVLKASEIAAQKTGHFSGRILGGEPPFFSAQFKYRDHAAHEIPHFNYPVSIDDQETQKVILSAIVEENYRQVKTDINQLFDQYRHLFETETEEV